MTHSLRYRPRFSLKPILLDLLIVGAFSLLGLFTGLKPDFQKRFYAMVGGSSTNNQTITDADVLSYVQTLLTIEQMRQSTYTDIKQRIGYVPAAECHRPEHLASLGDRVRKIATNYCKQAIKVVEGNGLTINEFNAITNARQTDPALANLYSEHFSLCSRRYLPTAMKFFHLIGEIVKRIESTQSYSI